MQHTRHATRRVPRGEQYWFIDFSPDAIHMGAKPCRESGHPFDNECFARHNYYLTEEDARKDIEEYEERREFRRQYIRDFNMFKALPPESKREYREKMSKQVKKEETR